MTHQETHPFETFLPDEYNSIIIGTFPCIDFLEKTYGNFFYSTTNKNLFWPILSEISQANLVSRLDKEQLLTKLQFGMADIAHIILRNSKTCSDKDFTIIQPNKILLELINSNSSLSLYFTSMNAQKWTQKYFFDLFKTSIGNKQINLPSPSQSANRSIARTQEYKLFKTDSPIAKTYQYRIEKYSKLINF